MIDELMIAKAIKLCISQLPKITDPIEYLYEVNQILNRFKTNLYKMMDERHSDHDPASLLTISIRSGGVIENAGGVNVAEVSKAFLKVYGIRGYGHVDGNPDDFCVTLDISDVFNAKMFCLARPDYYVVRNQGLVRARERYWITNHPKVNPDRHGIHISSDAGLGRTYNITGLISAIIYPEVLEEGRTKICKTLPSGKAQLKHSEETRAIMRQAAINRHQKLREQKRA